MRHKLKLRSRIVLSFLIFGTLLSGLFALTALGMRQYLENDLIGKTLHRDLEAHMQALETAPESVSGQPFASRISAFVLRPEQPSDELPVEFWALPSGVHERTLNARDFIVAVNKDHQVDGRPAWGYVVYDVTASAQETLLTWLLLAGAFIVFSLLALILAFWSSKRIMAPVSDLARRIDRMGNEDRPVSLAPHYANDEVGQLAAALDDYAERLTALVVRDKEFNADVSHELRTPLAVIETATELVLAQEDLDEKTRSRLKRIERAARQSTALTNALLHLVRAERVDHSTGEYFIVQRIVEQVVDFHRPVLGSKPVNVNVKVNEPLLVCAPDAVIAVALGNLIGNAFKYTPAGEVTITVGDGKVIVEDTGPGLEDQELSQIFARHYRGSSATGKGSGLGLAIVQRLCELYDWNVEIKAREGGGLRATLHFATSVAPTGERPIVPSFTPRPAAVH